MQTKSVEKYQCDLCHTWYNSKEEAERCESRPISQDKGVKVGDIVTITQGDGTGKQAKVTSVFVYDKRLGALRCATLLAHHRLERRPHQ